MRTIKFRAKRIGDGMWVEGHYYDDMGEHIIVAEGRHEVVDESTLGQFTGLISKDTTEINEGDILEHDNGRAKLRGEVVWDDGAYYVWWKYSNPLPTDRKDVFIGGKLTQSLCDKCVVIGNVTDNKELLS